ncbi:hypothetical protein ACTG9Q_31875 [Actinokineospora sp. 24-640]
MGENLGGAVPDFFTDKQGRVRPIRGKSGKSAVIGGVLALGVFASGGGFGSLGVGGGAVGGQVAAHGVVGSVRLGGAPGQLRARKIAGQKAAPHSAKRAWQRMGLREVKRTAKQQASCVATSFGQVRDFLTRHRCTYLERVLFTVGDDAGNTAVVSVAWVGLADRGSARQFRNLMDVQGSGDITPLGGPLLNLGEITFTGLRYGSVLNRTAVTVAEAENALGGQFDHESLDAIAEVAAYLPRP